MAHGADNRRDTSGHGPRHGFFVEAPQIFQRAAAPGQDQRIEPEAVGQADGAHDLCNGFAALYCGGDQVQFHLRGAATEHTDDVADHCTGGRGNDADALRVGWQRQLAFGAEQPLGTELFLQCFEGQAQGAITGRLDGVENQLVVATPLEQRNLAAHPHRQAIAQRLAYPRGVLPEQRATHLGAAVLEGEVHVAGRRAGEVGNLAFHPHAAEHVFQQHAGATVELADGKDLAVQAESFERVSDHGGHHKGHRPRLSVPALSPASRLPQVSRWLGPHAVPVGAGPALWAALSRR
ncbi:hypothetical protein D3C78_622800 [compost metagenome]